MLTASHIFKNLEEYYKFAVFVDNGKWVICPIMSIEHHPTEDVGIIKLNGDEWKSPFRISTEWQGGWKDYLTCGYPIDVVYENIINGPNGRTAVPKPELVHTKGYIRRIVNKNLDIADVRGTSFYELSTLAGKGYSGGPIFYIDALKIWNVMGIYTAEKENIKFEESDNENDKDVIYVYPSVAYAVKSDAFAHWKPNILGKEIIEESQNFFI